MPAGRAGVLRIALCALLGILSLWLALESPSLIANYRPGQAYYDSSAFFPRVGLWLAVGAAAAVIVGQLSNRAVIASDEVDAAGSRAGPALAALGLLAGYALLLPIVGYLPATALFAWCVGALIGLRWQARLLATTIALCVAWLVFVKLIPLAFPRSLLGSWLGLQ